MTAGPTLTDRRLPIAPPVSTAGPGVAAIAPALRIARRDVVRHPLRSLLIVVLVALPILGVTAVDVLYRSTLATAAEQVRDQLVDADAYLWAPRGATSVDQQPTDTWAAQFTGGPGTDGFDVVGTPIRPVADVLRYFPSGTRLTLWLTGSAPIAAQGSIHYRTVDVDQLDLRSPAAGRRYSLAAGSFPGRPGDVAVTEHLARQLGVRVGDAVSVGSPASPRTVVGLLRRPGEPDADAVVGLPGSVVDAYSFLGPRYLVTGSGPISWERVQQLNGVGIQVYSRQVALASPPPDAGDHLNQVLVVSGAVVAVVLGLLQVVFLAGPAFAITTRRMRQQLGILAATGASPVQLAAVTLAGAAVVGGLGVGVGLGGGVLLAALARPVITRLADIHFFALHVVAGDLAIIAALGLLTTLVAALPPAVAAVRSSPSRTVVDVPSSGRRAGWWSVLGAVICAAGVAVTVTLAVAPLPPEPGSILEGRGLQLAAGMVAVLVGLMLAAPLLILLAARVARWLPTVPRLALRAAARRRGRTAAGVAAVMATSAVAVSVAVLLATSNANKDEAYIAGLRPGQATVTSFLGGPADRIVPGDTKLPALVARYWPGVHPLTFRAATAPSATDDLEPAPAPGQRCPWLSAGGDYSPAPAPDDSRQPPTAAQLPRARVDVRCVGMAFSALSYQQARAVRPSGSVVGLPTLVVGDADLVTALTGVHDPAADRALASGGAVVFDRRYLAAGPRLTVTLAKTDAVGNHFDVRSRTTPAVLGTWNPSPVVAVLSAPAAARLGLTTDDLRLLVPDAGAVTQAMQDDLAAGAQAQGIDLGSYVERGFWPGEYFPGYVLWLVLSGAALLIGLTMTVITALSLTDSRADLATLGAVGASGRVRRSLSGWSALLVTGLGCLLGGAAGVVPAWGLVRLQQLTGTFTTSAFVVPWRELLTLGLGLPLAAYLVAGLLTRSRLPLLHQDS